jgi:hypothetical protein
MEADQSPSGYYYEYMKSKNRGYPRLQCAGDNHTREKVWCSSPSGRLKAQCGCAAFGRGSAFGAWSAPIRLQTPRWIAEKERRPSPTVNRKTTLLVFFSHGKQEHHHAGSSSPVVRKVRLLVTGFPVPTVHREGVVRGGLKSAEINRGRSARETLRRQTGTGIRSRPRCSTG